MSAAAVKAPTRRNAADGRCTTDAHQQAPEGSRNQKGKSKGIVTGSTGALAFGVRACNIGVCLGFSKLASAHPKAYETKDAESLNTYVMRGSLFCQDSAYLHC
jgi:hypothetical protein